MPEEDVEETESRRQEDVWEELKDTAGEPGEPG